jgi:Asp-tRNA(Asn)/Glu-tRNA(Gln) amidotransferase A subunit family amidase
MARKLSRPIVAPMNPVTTDPTTLSASDLAKSIAAAHLSVVDAVEAHIARIEQVNPQLNAVVVPLFDEARRLAQQADLTPPSERGQLHGVPVTVKECFDVAGTPSTAGLTVRSAHRAASDAPLVARLRQAGAIILGKTNVSQLLMFVETDNPMYGRTNNPLSADRSAGGSSGGEGAIVAARGSALGIGTDIGGSVRVPAHCCGIHSIKPTPGRLSVGGTVDIIGAAAREAIPDSGGLLARHVSDLRLALNVLSPLPESEAALRELRIGVYDDDGFFPASPAIRRAVREAAAALSDRGFQVVPFTPPDVNEALAIFYGLFGSDGGELWRVQLNGGIVDPRIKDLLMLAGMPALARPAIAGLLRIQGQRRLASIMGTAGKADAARVTSLTARRDAYRRAFSSAMAADGVDVLLSPPCAVPAFRHGATRELGPASVSYTCLYNLLAYPAGVVSTTFVREDEVATRPRSREKMLEAARLIDEGSAGLPCGVQVAAGPGREDEVLSVMAALEEVNSAHHR